MLIPRICTFLKINKKSPSYYYPSYRKHQNKLRILLQRNPLFNISRQDDVMSVQTKVIQSLYLIALTPCSVPPAIL